MNAKTITRFDQKKSEQFSQKMLQHFNGAALSLMISVAHRTGLFDAMKEMEPSTSEAIAGKAGLNERYVREALGAFVAGGVVEYDSETQTYQLPPEHAAWLTRGASPNNMAVTSQWFSVLGGVEDLIVECFKKGGGLRYEDYPRFHEVMSEESHQTVVRPLIESLLPLVPGLKEKLEKGIHVLDLGCGSGYALIHLARHFPKSRFTGYDLCEEAVERARQGAAEHDLKNIHFEVRDVAQPVGETAFDLITTFDAVHDQAKPAALLENIYRALKDDGTYFMQDIAGSSHVHHNVSHPVGPLTYTISCFHCMSVSLGQGGEGLGAMWGKEKACEMLKAAGFRSVEIKELDHDFMNYYYIVKK